MAEVLLTDKSVNPAPAPAGGWIAWRGPLLLALGTVLALRVVLSLWAMFVLAHFTDINLQTQYVRAGELIQSSGLAAPWQREDAIWYEKIANYGYGLDGRTAFFPLLPLAMRVMGVVTGGNLALAGILVSSIAALVAFTLLYRLVASESDNLTASRTVAYLALFPTAFFLYSAFTESLFLAITLGAFLCVRKGWWLAAAGLAVLAGLTKLQGAVLGVPLAVEYLLLTGWSLAAIRQRVVVYLTLCASGALGTLLFFAYVAYVVGDPIFWNARVNMMWHLQTTWPGETLFTSIHKVLSEKTISINIFDLIVLLGFTILMVGAFRQRISYGLQALTILAPSWLHSNTTFPLISVSRYVLVAFPCFIVLAHWAGRAPRIVHLAIITIWLSFLLVWSSAVVRGWFVG